MVLKIGRSRLSTVLLKESRTQRLSATSAGATGVAHQPTCLIIQRRLVRFLTSRSARDHLLVTVPLYPNSLRGQNGCVEPGDWWSTSRPERSRHCTYPASLTQTLTVLGRRDRCEEYYH